MGMQAIPSFILDVTQYNKSMERSILEPLEKLYELPRELFEAIDYSDMGVVKEKTDVCPRFVIGERYSLRGIACDGFEMQPKIYELVGEVDKYADVLIDAVIVKQVDGEIGQMFTLSKNDCANLKIEYENGLQLFPKNMSWERVVDKVPFDPNDLSTTPRSAIDNTIRYITLKLNGFKDYADGYILSPSGKLIKEEKFAKSLRVINNEPIVYGNGLLIKDKTKLASKLVTPKNMIFNHGNFISSNDEMFLVVSLAATPRENNGGANVKDKLIDGLCGVSADYLKGFDPHDMFTIAWDELACMSAEEYEAEKAKRKAILEARQKREEEARKKKIEEAERIAKLQRQRQLEEEAEKKRKMEEALKKAKEMETLNASAIEDAMKSFQLLDSAMSQIDTAASAAMYADNLEAFSVNLNKALRDMDNSIMQITDSITKAAMVPFDKIDSDIMKIFN